MDNCGGRPGPRLIGWGRDAAVPFCRQPVRTKALCGVGRRLGVARSVRSASHSRESGNPGLAWKAGRVAGGGRCGEAREKRNAWDFGFVFFLYEFQAFRLLSWIPAFAGMTCLPQSQPFFTSFLAFVQAPHPAGEFRPPSQTRTIGVQEGWGPGRGT